VSVDGHRRHVAGLVTRPMASGLVLYDERVRPIVR